jgi:hypothetical protein
MRRSLAILGGTVALLCSVAAEATCISAPTISASASGPDAQGNVTISGGWSFHNTDPNFTGRVTVIDSWTNSIIFLKDPAPLSGSISPAAVQNMFCRSSLNNPYHFVAIADGCGATSQDMTVSLPSTIPTVTISGGAGIL